MPETQLEKVNKLLQQFHTAMLVTQELNGNASLQARPMAIAHLEPSCDVWFFTGRDSGKVHAIQNNQQVLILCQKEWSVYLSLRGRASLVSDRTKMQELWKPTYKTWFPQGLEDPNLLLIFVDATEAEYWDNEGGNALKYAFQTVKARLAGTTPQVEEGEQHGRVKLI